LLFPNTRSLTFKGRLPLSCSVSRSHSTSVSVEITHQGVSPVPSLSVAFFSVPLKLATISFHPRRGSAPRQGSLVLNAYAHSPLFLCITQLPFRTFPQESAFFHFSLFLLRALSCFFLPRVLNGEPSTSSSGSPSPHVQSYASPLFSSG